jgi:predicted GIY-YIG superfamily endonuclease
MAIYVFALEGGRYYVGEAENVVKAFQEHLDGSGCSWTRKYRPLRIEEISRSKNQDVLVKRYMRFYGVNYVRGGSYQEITITPEEERKLIEEIWAPETLYPKPVLTVVVDELRNGVSGVFGVVSDIFGTVRDIVRPSDTETRQREYFRN